MTARMSKGVKQGGNLGTALPESGGADIRAMHQQA